MWFAVLVAALALFLTIDDRYAGAIADGRQMAWTAIAITETGEIGQARGRDFTWPRGGGDAVSRYGMGMSLAQVPAAWLAPRVEAVLGPRTSQPLFLILPFLCVCAAAAAAGWIALGLGLGTPGIASAVLLTAIGSPLGSYAALDLSEPLQAAALSIAFAFALASTHPDVERRRASLYAALAGFSAGVAILTKSSLWAAVPFALLPLTITGSRGATTLRERMLFVVLGLAGPICGWTWFEVVRFGRLFASYAGEGFTHPFLDGLWRLLIGPNRGLLLFFPALAVAAAAAIVAYRRPSPRIRVAVTASLGMLASLLALAATWWAWHGLWGWGPRLLVPAIPPLAASAAVLIDSWPRSARTTLLLVSAIVNMPGLLQNAAPVTIFTAACEWPAADARFAGTLAAYARRQASDGTYRVAPDQVLERVPQASPFVVYPWFASVTSSEPPQDVARRLKSPPWRHARPDVSCDRTMSEDAIGRLIRRPGWPVWGRAFWPDPNAPGFPGVYDEGLLDQVVRAQQLGRGEQALSLARKLARLAPDGEGDAQVLESLRILRRRADAVEYLSSLSPERRSQPKINVVLALFERDAGSETLARNLLGSVIDHFRGTPAQEALRAPLSAWPSDLTSMTTNPGDQAGRR